MCTTDRWDRRYWEPCKGKPWMYVHKPSGRFAIDSNEWIKRPEIKRQIHLLSLRFHPR